MPLTCTTPGTAADACEPPTRTTHHGDTGHPQAADLHHTGTAAPDTHEPSDPRHPAPATRQRGRRPRVADPRHPPPHRYSRKLPTHTTRHRSGRKSASGLTLGARPGTPHPTWGEDWTGPITFAP